MPEVAGDPASSEVLWELKVGKVVNSHDTIPGEKPGHIVVGEVEKGGLLGTRPTKSATV